jgi:hypothetical protein
VWFGTAPPPDPATCQLVLIDRDGDGRLSWREWNDSTPGPPGQDRGGPERLFDGAAAGSGFLCSSAPNPVRTSGIKARARQHDCPDRSGWHRPGNAAAADVLYRGHPVRPAVRPGPFRRLCRGAAAWRTDAHREHRGDGPPRAYPMRARAVFLGATGKARR